MSELHDLRLRLDRAERRLRRLTAIMVVLGATILLGAAARHDDILRVRGLVIVDDAGRERVLLGAPLKSVTSDARLVGATGLVVLDTAGLLNVAVGSDNPLVFAGGRIGERIAPAAGLTVYDMRHGGERGGFATLADGRANVCLDYAQGKEAACMTVAPDDQYSAVMLNGTPSEKAFDRVGMFLGADGSGVLKAFGGGTNKGGMMIRGGRGSASLTVFDTAGNRSHDLAAPMR